MLRTCQRRVRSATASVYRTSRRHAPPARPERAVEGGVAAVGLPPAGVTTFAIGG
jgi:hypothetical protein